MDKPYALLAELTYACPLHCPYCSNPLALEDYRDELTTDEWQRVFAEAADLGVLQVHLSGGEPLQRHDIVDLVQCANKLACTPPTRPSNRLPATRDAGLDHVQVGIQADEQTHPTRSPALLVRAEARGTRLVSNWAGHSPSTLCCTGRTSIGSVPFSTWRR
jgi:pyrroloquinoline quinone biosynthesis protein E